MNIAQELSIVKDNIAEYGMTNITQLEYDAIYEQGRRDAEKELNALGECEYRKGMADAIEEYHKEMHDIIVGDEEFTDWQKHEILLCNDCVLEQLEEQKNDY